MSNFWGAVQCVIEVFLLFGLQMILGIQVENILFYKQY